MRPFALAPRGDRRSTCSACALLAGLLLAFSAPGTANAAGVSPPEASAAQKKSAQDHYVEGTQLFEAGRFDDALAAFRASYDIVASPNSHLMLARSLVKKDDIVAAYDELVAVEIEADALEKYDAKYAEAVLSAAADRAVIRPRLGVLTVRVLGGDPSAKVRVGAKELSSDRWGKPTAVLPGPVQIIATLGDKRAIRFVSIAAGGTADINLDLAAPQGPVVAEAPIAPPATPSSPPLVRDAPSTTRTSLKPYAAVAGGVGAVGLVMFVVAGAMNRSTYGSVKDECPGQVCGAGAQADIDRGRSQQTIANVGLVIGLVGLGAGATIFLVDRKQSSNDGALSVGMTPGSLSLQRSF